MCFAEAALKSWFCDFLSYWFHQFKIPNILTRALVVAIPKSMKLIGEPKELLTNISALCLRTQSLRGLSTAM